MFVRWPRQWTLGLLCTYRSMSCKTVGCKCMWVYSHVHGPLMVGKSNMLCSVTESHYSSVLQLCLKLGACLDQRLLLFSGWPGLHVQDPIAPPSVNPFELWGSNSQFPVSPGSCPVLSCPSRTCDTCGPQPCCSLDSLKALSNVWALSKKQWN